LNDFVTRIPRPRGINFLNQCRLYKPS
jgi:hypothetical protein